MYRQRPRRPPRGGAYFRSSQALAANVPCAASRVQPCRRMAAICLIAAHRLIDLRGCCASVTVAGGREAGHCQAGAGELGHLAGIPAPRNSRRGSPGARPRPSAGLRRTENVGSQLLSLLQCPARGIVSAISGVVKKPKRRLRPATRIEPRGTPRAGTQGRRACHPMRLFTAPRFGAARSGERRIRTGGGHRFGGWRSASTEVPHETRSSICTRAAPLFVVRLGTFRHPTQTR